MIDFMDLDVLDFQQVLKNNNLPTSHWKTIFRNFYKDLNPKPFKDSTLPKKIENLFSPDSIQINKPKILKIQKSNDDGSIKFLLQLRDENQIETVLMPESNRITLCLSSQVGCRQGCIFCHTGRMGLIRNLTTAEIVSQVWLANKWIEENPDWLEQAQFKSDSVKQVTNLVFMGMGEPLDNFLNLSKAIDILNNPLGFYFSIKKISVSTAGHLDGMKALLKRFPKISLAFSLHNPVEQERSKLLPINRKWPLSQVIPFLKEYFPENSHRRSVLIQYTLIENVNDSLSYAKKIESLLDGVSAKLNIIPLNPIAVSSLNRPEQNALNDFQSFFHKSKIRPLIRFSKGQDISAACGQLIT